MTRLPRVLITVNPGLIDGNRFSTLRSIVTALDRHYDLWVLPIDGYDFKKRKARAYRRVAGGRFEFTRSITPAADMWIVYTDGYYLNPADQGFKGPTEYIEAQMEFHEEFSENGSVSRLINTVESERNTWKGSFAKLDDRGFQIIKTFIVTTSGEVLDLVKEYKVLIAKPNWSGGGKGVQKLTTQAEAADFARRNKLHEFCFQPAVTGDEKRFWFAGDDCVGARRIENRRAPWMDRIPDQYRSTVYDRTSGNKFERDLQAAKKMWRHSGLSIGSVDFIGDKINELNGCGTTFIDYHGWQKIVDCRKPLVKYVLSLLPQP